MIVMSMPSSAARERVDVRGGVVHRRRDHGPLALAELEDLRQHRARFLALLLARRRPHDALRLAGRPRGVDDAHRCGSPAPPARAPAPVIHCSQRSAPGGSARRPRRPRRRARRRRGTRRLDRRPQVGVQHQHLRAAVAEDVRDLLAAPMPVDRHRARAERHRRDRGLQELDRVAQQQRDPVARADAQLGEAAARPQRPARTAPGRSRTRSPHRTPISPDPPRPRCYLPPAAGEPRIGSGA